MRLASFFAIAFAAPAVESAEMFDFVRLDEGVYAALVKPRPPTYVFANSLIVIGDDAVLVVDTQQSPSAASEIAAEVRKLTTSPVKYVVNTHWHADHVYGNQTYLEQFPGVSFLGHHRTRDGVLGPGAKYLEEELGTLPESIREREAMLASDDLTEEVRERVEYSLSARTRYLEELRSLRLHPPDLTFSSKLTLQLGGREVEIHHLGPAHTEGDVVVYLPRERILAAGDLLEDAFPYFGDAYPSGWADVLDAIARFDAPTILPSHGPVLRDRELLDLERRLLRTLVTEVQDLVSEGKTLEEIVKAVTLDEFRSSFAANTFAESVRAAVERAYRGARGELSPR